jgi:glycosyltransferase involved in cell wall biosynthesis
VKKILHISYDLRDRYDQKVTPAISRLIDLSKKELDTFTIDLVRTPNPLNENMRLISSNHLKINALGFPYGIFMNWTQNRVIDFITKAILKNMIDLSEISLIHSHKMSFEGLVGYKLSIKHHIPLVITLRQTDAMVINRKPGAIRTFKPVIKRCKKIFYLIPQILIRMEELFGENFFRENIAPKAVFLPNIVERQVSEDNSDQIQKRHFVTVLKMNKRIVQRKNIKKLLKAFGQLKNYEITLTIVGDGEYRNEVERWVRKFNLVDKVTFAGNIHNDQIDVYYKRAEAFLLPSFSESFGLVYAEALLNGTPIMFSKGYLGFDGFYDGIGVGVNPRSIKSIANGIIDLTNNSEVYRQNIKKLSEAGEFNIFNSKYIGNKYIETINEVC